MATINATNTSNPITVAQGGTGLATLTAHSVQVGAGTSNITQIGVGTNGQCLLGSTGADPVFATLASSAGTIAYTTGAGTLDIHVKQPLVMTSQPAFQAYLSGSPTNVTGDGTSYTIAFDTALFDQASNFNTGTNLFVAPVAGIYSFSANVSISNLSSGHTIGRFWILVNTVQYNFFVANPWAIQESNACGFSGSVTVKLAANDTVGVKANISGSTKTVGIFGGAPTSGATTSFSGALIC